MSTGETPKIAPEVISDQVDVQGVYPPEFAVPEGEFLAVEQQDETGVSSEAVVSAEEFFSAEQQCETSAVAYDGELLVDERQGESVVGSSEVAAVSEEEFFSVEQQAEPTVAVPYEGVFPPVEQLDEATVTASEDGHESGQVAISSSRDFIEPDGMEGLENSKEKKTKKKFHFRWSNMSYVSRVTLSFAMVAAFTAAAAILVVTLVWGQYLQDYTSENMETLARTTANRLAALFEADGFMEPDGVRSVAQAAETSPEVGVKVLDAHGATIYETENANGDGTSFEPSDSAQIALANITVDHNIVGSVRIWIYGSDTLMNRVDQKFRDDSIMALVVAAFVAVFVASIIGYFFARRLVAPINRLTRTAAAVKAGKLNARSDLHGEDEIAHLSKTFDSMVASVERDRQFERRVTSDVAHELRTPLMSIQASVEAMIDGVYASDQEHLELVDNEVRRLSRLVDALLKLSRLENRSQPMKQEVIDLGELVREIALTHELFVTESGLTISYNSSDRVLVLGDQDMIRQAVVNLISNAIRYTPAGGHINVSVRRGTAMASIIVADTGIGLTPDEAKMVFSRFWRADAGRTRASGGLGIGLAVVKEVVERHNGWVSVEGEKGKGATFTIHLPLYEDTVAKVRAYTGSKQSRGSLRSTAKK